MRNRPQRSLTSGLVWVYLILLLAEGALRKWLLPEFSDALLLVRDPVVVLAYLAAIREGFLPANGFILLWVVLAFAALIGAALSDTSHMVVVFYGLKANFLHLPFLFVIGSSLDRQDVIRIGKLFLFLCLPLALLMAVQFRADPNHFWNFGPGATPGAQMEGALGRIRPPGFFSFITGAAQFLALATAFLLFGLLERHRFPYWMMIASGICLIICLAVSISRLAFGMAALVVLMIPVAFLVNPGRVNSRLLIVASALGLCLFTANSFDVFREGVEAFENRLERTGDLERTMAGRVESWGGRWLAETVGALNAIQRAPLLGYGVGAGTNVGGRMMTGQLGFYLAEEEWARLILEMGPFVGLLYIFTRISLCVFLLRYAIRDCRKGNFLPLLLFGACFSLVLSGQIGQSTTLGFMVFGAGLTLASMRGFADPPTQPHPTRKLPVETPPR